MKTALITGISGQDGFYMTELLIEKNYRIIGAARDIHKAKMDLPPKVVRNIEFIEWDMLDQQRMMELLAKYRPHELYNFAACSSGAAMFDDPVSISDVNGLAVARILEAIRFVDINIRFCQASSSELFGDPVESPQSETTPLQPRSPYGAAKLYAHAMIQIYRQRYGLFANSAILFNHESPRRGLGFVTRKITHEAAKIKLGLAKELYLGNLDARRDWGFAGDHVQAMWLMLQQPSAEDYVLATGLTHSVRELCHIAFNHLDLDYRDYVREDAAGFRPNEAAQLVGDAKKAKDKLGWENRIDFQSLVQMMVDADLNLLK
jgi:GDPmannose 4,6-dehydratase